MLQKKIYLFFFFFLGCFCTILANKKDSDVMQAMAQRLIPKYAGQFVFKQSNALNGKDYFKLESKDKQILISGNNANSMAMGLNYYLKYYCLTTVSWYAGIPVEMPAVLPTIDKPFTAEAKVARRFFLNYCTYGYTMPYWKWSDWERFIDWMALNGINMPLAITGQEAVWYNVWKKLGLSDDEICSYFTGPTYLPWHRMANIDGWNGPLPMHWLETQAELQRQILSRERELNMKPVLPAFAGHVPAALKRIYPDANIQYLGKWAGFDDQYRCHFLNPEEPLFAKIQKEFLKEQEKLYGTNHIYGIDPFNEVDPPSWEPGYLRKVSSDIYRTLTNVDSQAEWMQMTWMFYFDRKEWTASRVESLLTGVPKNKMILLDYHCENVELWKKTKQFYGQPYIWCYLGNFGGNTVLTGNVKESGKRLDNALLHGGNNLQGIGSTLEGLDVMQFPYEYIFEKAWKLNIQENEWINNLADRHAGYISESVREAWQILFNDIYIQVPRTLGILPCLSPQMGKPDKRSSIDYKNATLLKVWQKLLQAPLLKRDAIRIDLIAVGRQLLGNHFMIVKEEYDKMYQDKNLKGMQESSDKMCEILQDIDALTYFHDYCTLNHWTEKAKDYGNTPQLQSYYEENAKNLITTWGGRLNDYANRAWFGLIQTYYTQRWKLYFNATMNAVRSNQLFDQKALDKELKIFEDNWVENPIPTLSKPNGTLEELAHQLLKKYETAIALEK